MQVSFLAALHLNPSKSPGHVNFTARTLYGCPYHCATGKGRLSRIRVKETHTAGAYPGFCSMKQLRVLLLPPGWDASPLQGYPQQYVAGTQFIPLG